MFYRLNKQQLATLETHVQNREVYDLGAGDGSAAALLIDLGAEEVIAVDKHPIPIKHPQIQPLTLRFSQLVDQVETIDMAFISCPQNQLNTALIELIRRATTVVYLGSNTNGNACGSPQLFKEFAQREILEYIPDRPNTLIIYGDYLQEPRGLDELRGEEFAGITLYQQSRPFSFEEVEELDF